MTDIQVVTLDLWQTLVIDTREWGRERTRIRIEDTVAALKEAGEIFTEEQVREAFRAGYRQCREVHRQGLDVSFREQVQMFVRGIAPGLLERLSRETFATILNRYADSFYDSPPMVAPGVEDTLLALKEAGYRLGIISNTGMTSGRTFRSYLDEQRLAVYFDHFTFSDEVLMTKPSRSIFLHTLASMGGTTAASVHVGDHLLNDIKGASDVGMRTVWLQGFDDSQLDVKPTATIQNIKELPRALEGLSKVG
ncbi:MAG: HAD family hydrolase [Chloroflexi bacterium]|nr:HAD family hydrolase [Chloroflexota bacterium]